MKITRPIASSKVPRPSTKTVGQWVSDNHRPAYEEPLRHYTPDAIEARVQAAITKNVPPTT